MERIRGKSDILHEAALQPAETVNVNNSSWRDNNLATLNCLDEARACEKPH